MSATSRNLGLDKMHGLLCYSVMYGLGSSDKIRLLFVLVGSRSNSSQPARSAIAWPQSQHDWWSPLNKWTGPDHTVYFAGIRAWRQSRPSANTSLETLKSYTIHSCRTTDSSLLAWAYHNPSSTGWSSPASAILAAARWALDGIARAFSSQPSERIIAFNSKHPLPMPGSRRGISHT
jgi:hypothetical protein